MESKNLTVKEIVKCTNGKLIIGDESIICKRFERDTREIKEDDVFIAFKGERVNGNMLWKDAFDKGAKVAILTEVTATEQELEKYKDRVIIKVEDIIDALAKIATKKRELYGEDFPVIAVTGSVGKTSTKDIIASVLAQKYKVLKTEGNYNNHIGLPLTILRLQDEEVAVIEMGMNHFEEISRLTKIVKPTISLITNIGTSHIGNLGSRENILKAKLEILEGMKTPFLILNNDNDLLHNWYEENKNKIEIKTFGIENQSDAMATDIDLQENYSEFTCNIQDRHFRTKVPAVGEHYVLNSLCAALIGSILNLTNEQIEEGIEKFELTKKRMEISTLKNGATLMNDSYNASYESMKAAIESLSSMKNKRKIAVLGDMFELGKFSKELHQNVGKVVAKNNIDILICSGENSKDIIEEAVKCGMPEQNVYYCKDIDEIIKLVNSIIRSDDSILIKASNGMQYYKIADYICQ